MRKVLLFRIGKKQFGLDLPKVVDIRKTSTVNVESSNGPRIKAVTSEGSMLTLYDMTMLLNRNDEPENEAQESQLMMIKGGEHMMGLKVDSVSRVISVDNDLFEFLPPVFGNTAVSCFPWIIKYEDTLIPLLDPVGIEKYEIVIQKIDSDGFEMAPAGESIDEFDIIELTEVVGKGTEIESSDISAGAESADEFLETLDSEEDVDDALIPIMEDPSGLPPAEIIQARQSGTPAGKHLFQQWGVLPDNEDELESFFEHMVEEEQISRMILRIVHRFAETAVKREISKLKEKKAFFPNAAGNVL